MSGRSLTELKRGAKSYGSPMGTEDPIDNDRPTVSASNPAQVRSAMKQPTAPASASPSAPAASPAPQSDFATGVDYLIHPKKRPQDIDNAVDDAT